MPKTLQELLTVLDQYAERVPLDDLTEWLEHLEIDLSDVRDYLGFGSNSYQRNLLRAGDAYHALVLCWRNGQRSPIHDHRGSNCAVRVLQGVATETQFANAKNGLIVPTVSRELAQGEVCGSHDDDMHQMSNLQAGNADLVTLHIYSPPLMKMRQFSLTDAAVSEFDDPIFEYAMGGGI